MIMMTTTKEKMLTFLNSLGLTDDQLEYDVRNSLIFKKPMYRTLNPAKAVESAKAAFAPYTDWVYGSSKNDADIMTHRWASPDYGSVTIEVYDYDTTPPTPTLIFVTPQLKPISKPEPIQMPTTTTPLKMTNTNPLTSPDEYHAAYADAPTVDWSEKGLTVTRLRLLSDPGHPIWDVSYCDGRLADGTLVRVQLPFDQVPKSNVTGFIVDEARKAKVYARGLGILNSISLLS